MPMRVTKISTGMVQGVPCGNPRITVFRGIPYGDTTAGKNRFRPPQPPKPWEGVRLCDTFSEIAMQRMAPAGMPFGDFFRKEFYPVEQKCGEDCLKLNVWTPAKSSEERLPVMFWIHGGGLGSGYGHEMEFDGEALCKEGVVLITINYRLNYFGFFAHPDLSAESEYGVSGNYGMLDQIAALKWVQENIAAFGGDPDKRDDFRSVGRGRFCCFPFVYSKDRRPVPQGDHPKRFFRRHVLRYDPTRWRMPRTGASKPVKLWENPWRSCGRCLWRSFMTLSRRHQRKSAQCQGSPSTMYSMTRPQAWLS